MTAASSTRGRVLLLALLAMAVIASVLAGGVAKAAPDCFGAEATIVGTDGADELTGTKERDVIVGRGGDDLIVGRAGNDLVCAGAGDDEVDAGDGRDTVDGGEESVGDKLFGQRGADTLYAGGGSFYDFGHGDFLAGNIGEDVLEGTAGLDFLYGGVGADMLRPRGTSDPFTAQVAHGGDDNDAIVGGSFLGHGEYDPEEGFVYQTLIGDDGNDEILGGLVNDEYPEVIEQLEGGAGDDSLDGRSGTNTNDGGDGTDTCANPDTGEAGATNCES